MHEPPSMRTDLEIPININKDYLIPLSENEGNLYEH